MTDVVFAHEGTVAKIVGDALHVLFGAPGPAGPRGAGGLRPRPGRGGRGLPQYRWRERGIEIGVTRIGVHAGPAIVGNFGGGRYFDYTAYGDTINTAARLENANKAFGTRICVSDAVVIRAGPGRPPPRRPPPARQADGPARLRTPDGSACGDALLAQYQDAYAKLDAGEPARWPPSRPWSVCAPTTGWRPSTRSGC